MFFNKLFDDVPLARVQGDKQVCPDDHYLTSLFTRYTFSFLSTEFSFTSVHKSKFPCSKLAQLFFPHTRKNGPLKENLVIGCSYKTLNLSMVNLLLKRISCQGVATRFQLFLPLADMPKVRHKRLETGADQPTGLLAISWVHCCIQIMGSLAWNVRDKPANSSKSCSH